MRNLDPMAIRMTELSQKEQREVVGGISCEDFIAVMILLWDTNPAQAEAIMDNMANGVNYQCTDGGTIHNLNIF